MTGFIGASINWEAVFYIQGGLSVIWLVMWPLCVTDNPANNPYIRASEWHYWEEAMRIEEIRKTVSRY